MKIRILGVFVAGAILGSAISAIADQGTAGSALANFEIEITVDREANGARLECVNGCSWETLSFSCDSSAANCAASIDQSGTH